MIEFTAGTRWIGLYKDADLLWNVRVITRDRHTEHISLHGYQSYYSAIYDAAKALRRILQDHND